MRKTHYIPVTADVPGAASDANCALIRRTIRTALAAEGVTAPCEVDVLLTDDEGIHRINLDMRQVDRPTDVLSFPEFDLDVYKRQPQHPGGPGRGGVPAAPTAGGAAGRYRHGGERPHRRCGAGLVAAGDPAGGVPGGDRCV